MSEQKSIGEMIDQKDFYNALQKLGEIKHPVITQIFPKIKFEPGIYDNSLQLTEEQEEALSRYVTEGSNTVYEFQITYVLPISIVALVLGGIGLILLLSNSTRIAMLFLILFLMFSPLVFLCFRAIYRYNMPDKGYDLMKYVK